MIPKIIHFCWMSGDAYPEKNKGLTMLIRQLWGGLKSESIYLC